MVPSSSEWSLKVQKSPVKSRFVPNRPDVYALLDRNREFLSMFKHLPNLPSPQQLGPELPPPPKKKKKKKKMVQNGPELYSDL